MVNMPHAQFEPHATKGDGELCLKPLRIVHRCTQNPDKCFSYQPIKLLEKGGKVGGVDSAQQERDF